MLLAKRRLLISSQDSNARLREQKVGFFLFCFFLWGGLKGVSLPVASFIIKNQFCVFCIKVSVRQHRIIQKESAKYYPLTAGAVAGKGMLQVWASVALQNISALFIWSQHDWQDEMFPCTLISSLVSQVAGVRGAGAQIYYYLRNSSTTLNPRRAIYVII